jgi:hypothetical protein
MGTPGALRAGSFDADYWLASKHGSVGTPLGDYWEELEAVQVCIWAQLDNGTLVPERVPSYSVLNRAKELCRTVAHVDPAKDSPYPVTHRRIELSPFVRRSSASTVNIEVRLADLDTNTGLDGYRLDASYDEIEVHPITGKGGVAQLSFPRRDDNVLFEVHYRGDYSVGIPWVSADGTEAPIVTAEQVPVQFSDHVQIKPSDLTSGPSLAYQQLGDFMAAHTPLPPRPGAAIGLVLLLLGWAITLGTSVFTLGRKVRKRKSEGDGSATSAA